MTVLFNHFACFITAQLQCNCPALAGIVNSYQLFPCICQDEKIAFTDIILISNIGIKNLYLLSPIKQGIPILLQLDVVVT